MAIEAKVPDGKTPNPNSSEPNPNLIGLQ
jgi:hypothetical protein